MRATKKIILALIFCLTAVGLALATMALASSLAPSAKAKSDRAQHDISHLRPGSYLLERFGRSSARKEKVLIIRTWENDLFVYLMPTVEGKIPIPEYGWGDGEHYCRHIAPETAENGQLKRFGEIVCHDADAPPWGKNSWRWAYDGTAKSNWLASMDSPEFEVHGSVIYINR